VCSLEFPTLQLPIHACALPPCLQCGPIRLPSIQDRLHDVGREQRKPQHPRHVRRRDPLPLGQFSDGSEFAALKITPTPELKRQWRELFDSESPPFNRRYLESRLAYRIQELAYGGLRPETVRRLERLGEELDGGDRKKSRIRAGLKPIIGTRLIREWQGVEHVVTVTADGYEWQGRPYKSLSAYLYRMLNNRAYLGEAVHKGENFLSMRLSADVRIPRSPTSRASIVLEPISRKRAKIQRTCPARSSSTRSLRFSTR